MTNHLKIRGRGLIAALLGATMLTGAARADDIEFWTQTYGDLVAWSQLMDTLAGEFESESGTTVNIETVSWPNAFQTWLTVANGGAAPDCGDMYWLHSFSGIGGETAGPMPLNEYKNSVWPTLEQDYYEGALVDVIYDGDFYGIPWRGDIRPMMYRTDAFEAAGIDAPPATWDELVEDAKALTIRDGAGNVTQWGVSFGGQPNPVSALFPLYWQAGGEFMSEDGKTATIDNEAMRAALSYMRDMIWVHKAASPDFMEKSYDMQGDFISGRLAIITATGVSTAGEFDRTYPELEGLWAMAPSAAGPKNAATFSGAGYYGVLRGTEKVQQCVDWIAFLSRPENMERLSQTSGNVSPMRAVMETEAWSDRPWKKVATRALEDAHTSQQPSPSWSAVARPEPGAVLYDMMYDAIILQKDLDATIAAAQERMQAELDRTQ